MLANGADEARVAYAVMVAAGKTFARVGEDGGFREAVRLIMQLALAGSRPNTATEPEAAGLSPHPTGFHERVDHGTRMSDAWPSSHPVSSPHIDEFAG